MMMLNFLNDAANDAELTQKIDQYVIFASLKSESTYKPKPQIRLRIAYLRNCLHQKTQLNSFLCIQKCNKNQLYSSRNFLIAYDAIVLRLPLPFLQTTKVIVGYKFIHGVVPNLVY